MNWSKLIRQTHRWVSVAFVVVVLGIFGILGFGGQPAEWIYFLPLFPLALLALTGVYLFVLPYAAKRRGVRAGG